MDIISGCKAVFMGVVEGLTEFIPVSSTGHLIVAGKAIGFDTAMSATSLKVFEIVIQLGAILAVCWYYRLRIWQVVQALPKDANARRFALGLVLAFVPAGIVGFLAHDYVDKYLMNPAAVGAALALGGFAILLIERSKLQPSHADSARLPWPTVIGIGCCQCLAVVFPGTSRSAATIMGAMLLGVERKAATEFSFFLAIPTMFAATVYSLFKHRHDLTSDGLGLIAIGFVVSFVVALAVVHWLIKFVASHTFTGFAWYRIAAAAVLAILIVTGVMTTF